MNKNKLEPKKQLNSKDVRKWKIISAVTAGIGVISIGALSISIVNALEAKDEYDRFESVNKSLRLLTTAYADNAQLIAMNEDNIDDLSSTVASNVDNLLDSIQDSSDALTLAYKDDITSKVSEMLNAWDQADEGEDPISSDEVDLIYNSISDLQNSVRSVEKQQESIQTVIEATKEDVNLTLTDLWTSIGSLNTALEPVVNGNDINATNIEIIADELDTIQVKILELDKIKQQVANVESESQHIVDSLTSIIGKVDNNSYDFEQLSLSVANVEVNISTMNTTLNDIRGLIDITYEKLGRMEAIIDELEEEVAIIGDAGAINGREIDALKLDVADLLASKIANGEKFDDIIANLNSMRISVDDVMKGNAELSEDIDALHSKNDQIMYSLILLQEAVLNLETDFSSRSTVVNITNTYNIKVGNTKTYPNIHVDQLSKSKNISVFLKVVNRDTGTAYYTDIVSAYPKIGASFLGASTTLGKEQHLLNIRIDEDKIAVIGSWFRKSSQSSWKDVTSDNARDIYIEGVTITY